MVIIMGKNKNYKKQQKNRKNKAQNNAQNNAQQASIFDPLGSYTGRPKDRNETPEQDADDL